MFNPEDLIRDEVEYPAQTQQLQKHYTRSQADQRSLLSIRTRLLEQRALSQSTNTTSSGEASQKQFMGNPFNEQSNSPVVGQFHHPPVARSAKEKKKTPHIWYRLALVAVLCIAILGGLWYTLLHFPGPAGQPVKPRVTPQQNSSIHIDGILATTMTSATGGWARITTNQGRTFTVARTTDGGKTWQPFDFNHQQAGLMGVGASFLDDQTAWVVLGSGTNTQNYVAAKRTTDGGQHWTDLRLPAGMANITFVDRQHGWDWDITPISQSESTRSLYATADGGMTWHSVSVMDTNRQPGVAAAPGPLPFDGGFRLSFTTPQHGWAILSAGNGIPHAYLYQTQDGGKTWALQQLPEPASGPIPGIHVPMQEDMQQGGAHLILGMPQFFTPQQGVLSITSQIDKHSPDEMYLYATNDGGQSWSPLGNKLEKTSQFPDYPLVLDSTHLLLIDTKTITPYILINNQWQPQHATTMQDDISSTSVNDEHVWVYTNRLSGNQIIETLYTSNDRGNSWQQLMQNIGIRLRIPQEG